MKLSYIEIIGRQYPICFSLAVTETICDEFGSLEGMTQALNGDIRAQIRAVDIVLTAMLKAGRIYAQAIGEDVPPELPGNVANFIDISDPTAITAIFATIHNDSKRTIETKPKNAETK